MESVYYMRDENKVYSIAEQLLGAKNRGIVDIGYETKDFHTIEAAEEYRHSLLIKQCIRCEIEIRQGEKYILDDHDDIWCTSCGTSGLVKIND